MPKVHVTVENPSAAMAAGYTVVQIHRGSSPTGTFTLVSSLTLTAAKYHYTLDDTGGSLTSWYKWRLSNGVSQHGPFSNPFRPVGTNRRLIRQRALSDYRAGLKAAATGGSSTTINTSDPRVASELFPDRYHRGSWVHMVNGTAANLGQTRLVANSTPAGVITISPALPSAVASGDEFELHWMASPEDWNLAIDRAMLRYWYVDAVPFPGGQEEYDLSVLPWLESVDHVHGLFYLAGDIQRPWFGDGRWYGIQEDKVGLKLVVRPVPHSSITLYLECTRRMPPLPTDDSTPPDQLSEELAAALAYDELLKMLALPGRGSTQDHSRYHSERLAFHHTLRRLLRQHTPRPRKVPRVFAEPPVVPMPFRAR